MPIIEIEVSRVVHYSQEREVSQQEYDQHLRTYQEAASDRDQDVQEMLESLVDPRDVVDAEEFEVLNIIFHA